MTVQNRPDDPHPITGWRNTLDALEESIKAAERATVESVVSHLRTTKQIAQTWEVPPNSITMIRTRHPSTFPDPVCHFGIIPVFWGPDVDDFMRAYQLSRGEGG